jgi:hypothetical protein
MIWKKMIIVMLVLAAPVSVLAWLRVYTVWDGATGTVVWNSTRAYVFINTYQYGYTFNYLGYLGELIQEILPFGASSPEREHFYARVFYITPSGIERYSVDNFHIGSPPFVVGQNIYVGNLITETGLMKWSGTHFAPISADEQKIVRDALNSPARSDNDDIGGWTVRLVDFISAQDDADITIELDGRPLKLITHSGFADHEAFIDLTRPGRAPERIWHLNEKAARVSQATYKQIFSSD